MSIRELAQPVSEGFGPYVWSASSDEVADRHGLDPAQVLKFDQNTPPLPGVPQVALAESMARLNQYPDGTYSRLLEAAASYCGVTPANVVVGAGADDLILLLAAVFLGPGRRASHAPPTYALYRIATQLRGAELVEAPADADLHWVCNPNNPTGVVVPADAIAELARDNPRSVVVCDEAYVEYGGDTVASWVDELPNLVVLRTMSKAFGFASLRVGYALAHPETAALLTERRAPAPISGPAAAIAAAALRDPRLDEVSETVAERERMRSSLSAVGYDCPAVAGNFVLVRSTEPLGERLEAQGMVVRSFPGAIRITPRRPGENDLLLRALGADPVREPGREATVLRTSTETALRITLTLDGAGRGRVVTGIGFLDHLLTLLGFHAGFDLDVVAGGDLEVDDHHLVEDVLAALGTALAQALQGREGVQRYGSAVVPMDEARALAAVDLVRRPHAEISLSFASDRVGGLAVTLLAHALERFAMEAGCTVHVEAAGLDDHHVAEAAFKALGQALRTAVARGDGGIRSTKGLA